MFTRVKLNSYFKTSSAKEITEIGMKMIEEMKKMIDERKKSVTIREKTEI